jgi:hypothetical protein
MPAEVLTLEAYRLERAVRSQERERLPLDMTAHPGAVSVVIGDELELWLSPSQAEDVARDLARLGAEARRG